MQHDIDIVTYWCLRCGQGLRELRIARSFECQATSNVVAITHIVRGRRLARVVGETTEAWRYNPPKN